ncbi:MAG TPA: rhomboid family intramembrane serine protease [Dehalococcoidia bacterium]|nr:rhomboid family intramembrane serine protease [Dehalococcoidia bacterium]
MMLNPALILIGVNVVMFFVTLAPDLIDHLSLLPGQYFTEQPWGLITSMFVHGSFYHIFANMFTLYFFGSFLLRLVGDRWFWLIYLAGGILGGVFYVVLAPLTPPMYPAIGASGAVFALAGTLVILAPRLRVYIFPIPVPLQLWIAVIGGFLLISFFPNVAWQAHLGGLLFGMAAAYYIKRRGGRRVYF